MGKVVDIKPEMPIVREILQDPKGHFVKMAAQYRAMANHLRLSPEANTRTDELADDLDALAVKTERAALCPSSFPIR